MPMNLQFTTMNEIWEPHGKDYWITQSAASLNNKKAKDY